MASKTESLRYLIEAIWKGGGATAAASKDIASIGGASKTADAGLGNLIKTGAAVGVALGAVALTAKQVYQAFGEGADLELAASRFDKLTESIGTTSEALLKQLGAATSGMVSNAEMIASANQIISLGLADTEDGVVRLANLIAQLGWDMQQVIMTFANDSKMRLDALGLSVTDVEERMKALTDAGMDAGAAFDLAVIEAGEEKLQLLGSAADTAVGDMRRLEASWRDLTDAGKLLLAQALGPIVSGLANLVGPPGAAGKPSAFDLAEEADSVEEYLDLLREAGISWGTREQATAWFTQGQLQRAAEGADAGMLQLRRTVIDTAAVLEDARQQAAARGRGGGLLGNLIGDPGESLADLQARLEAINAPMREMIRLRDEAARAATTARRQEFGGFVDFDTAGMGDANAVLLETATTAGAAAEQLYVLAGGGQAAGDALIAAAGQARAAQLGEAVAAGLITAKDAMTDLQTFMDGLTLEDVFKMDEPIAGAGEAVETAKQEMLRVVEGMDTSVAAEATPATEAISKVDEALTLLDEKTAAPEIDPGTESATEELETFRRYFNDNIASLSAAIPITYVVEGGIPGAPPPPGRASGGPVVHGSAYVVGEKGPEVFVPHSSGWVVPNGGQGRPVMAGSMSGAPAVVVQNFNGLGVGGAVAVARRTLANYTRGTR